MKIIVALFLSFYFCSTNFAQFQKTENYKGFDRRFFYFGVQLGVNNTSFKFIPSSDAYTSLGYSLIESIPQPGLQFGMVTSMKLFIPVLRLRLVPTFSFQERVINYYTLPLIKDQISEDKHQERVNSSNIDFPLMLQLRTLRYGNFTSYCLGGIQYSIDLQSLEEKTQNLMDPFIKIKKKDVAAQVGAGIEFFNEYYKFGIELKYSQGFSNVFIKDNVPIAKPIDVLINNSWIFSITFEG